MELTTLDLLLDKLSDGICVSTPEGNVLYMNSTARTMLEVDEEEVRSRNLCETLCGRLFVAGPMDCGTYCPLRKAGATRKAVTYVGRHGPKTTYEWGADGMRRSDEWKDLRVHCLKLTTSLFDQHKSEKHFTIIEDASAEGELARHKEDWRSMIAHDLRTPLSVIYASLRALEDAPAAQALKVKERNLLEIGVRNCRRMTELLDLYMEVARFDAGSMPLELKAMPVLDVVAKCVDEMAPLAAEKRISVSVDIKEDLAARTDAYLLFRVLQNLLSNALKFTPAGGAVHFTAAGVAGGRVSISVKDAGCGIAPDDLPFIFDRFHHAKARREQRIQGNGLGLTFCKEAVKAMGGDIEVRSTPGKGSEFRVFLPEAVPAGSPR